MTGTGRGFRLSAQQERIWSQQSDHKQAWQAQAEVALSGDVEPSRLHAAVTQVVRRHEILRTVFHQEVGLKLPFQVIRDEDRFVWQTTDCATALDDASRSSRQTKADETDHEAPLCGRLVQQGPQCFLLRLTLPSMCADAVSLKNLIVEIFEAYESSDHPSDEVLQYADIAQWQHDLLDGEEGHEGRSYWRNYCREMQLEESPLDALLTSKEAEFQPALLTWRISGAPHNAREFLLGCWSVFLMRILGCTEVTIGCDSGDRKYDELQTAIGPLTAFLPLRFRLEPEALLAEHVEQAASTLTAAAAWQESFSWLNLADSEIGLAPPRIGFEYLELPSEAATEGVVFSISSIDCCSEAFDLKLAGRLRDSELSLSLQYNASKLSRPVVEGWRDDFNAFLISALADPFCPAVSLPIVSSTERMRLTVDWNQTFVDYPRERCIFELIENQVDRTPERTAVRYLGQCIRYRELNEQANQLAHALRRLGTTASSVVALCVAPGVETIVGLLGILKSGAAYTPLSTDLPPERIAAQLAGTQAVVTQQRFIRDLPTRLPDVICLDTDVAGLSVESTQNPAPVTTPENLAYVIYTSGSTGVPKGVAVRHRNLVNYASHISHLLGAASVSGGLAFATVSTLNADLGNTCIFPSLISGGCLQIIPSEVATDCERLRAVFEQHPADVLKIVPSHLSALLEARGGGAILPRRFLILGGEVFPVRLLETVRDLSPSCEIFNHYGPTETTVGSLMFPLADYLPHDRARSVPIGRSIANTRIYVLDEYQQLVPAGVAGELYIGGDGVAAGYLNQPGLTAERFIPDPVGEVGLCYRTGDFVRYLQDGNVEFLGRKDDQVKIRGFRIELGEIEAALLSTGFVSAAVVLAREDARGDVQLAAYVTPRLGCNPSPEKLNTAVRSKLPHYMIPASISVLAQLPLTANGKVDRQKLPFQEAPTHSDDYIAARTVTESVVSSIWSEVLGRSRIGRHDNFFTIGGHSLLATQVISRVRRSFEVDPPLRLIFDAPTVSGLAAWIDQARRTGDGLSLPPIVRASREQPLPLSFAQQRLWLVDQLDPNNPLYNVPRRIRIQGVLQLDALRDSLNEMVRRHESLRTTFALRNDEPVQVVHNSSEMQYEVESLISLPEAKRQQAAVKIALRETSLPFDLFYGPLVRARLLEISQEEHVLLLTSHHIISDRWSASIFLKELGAIYAAYTSGQQSPLPEPVIQYADYAAWQRQCLKGDTYTSLLTYWKEQLRGAPTRLNLPVDGMRSQDSDEGACETVWLSSELSETIATFSRKQDVTPFMTLLTAYQLLLSRHSHQERVVVGTDVANRNTVETESLIGFFINLLPLHTDLSGDPSFRELLQRVRRVALGAYVHQDMPFEKLVEELHPDRAPASNPLLQVLFVMLNTPSPERTFPGLELTEFEVPLTRSKFELAVFVSERENCFATYWVYRTGLFEPGTIQRFARHFEMLLSNALRNPDTRLSALEMLSEEEKQQRDSEGQGRKQSHLKNLRTVQPRIADLSLAPPCEVEQ